MHTPAPPDLISPCQSTALLRLPGVVTEPQRTSHPKLQGKTNPGKPYTHVSECVYNNHILTEATVKVPSDSSGYQIKNVRKDCGP